MINLYCPLYTNIININVINMFYKIHEIIKKWKQYAVDIATMS